MFINILINISLNVPLYLETQELYLKLSDFFLQNNSKIIDLDVNRNFFK